MVVKVKAKPKLKPKHLHSMVRVRHQLSMAKVKNHLSTAKSRHQLSMAHPLSTVSTQRDHS